MKPDSFPLGLICGVLLSVAGYLAWANKSDVDTPPLAVTSDCVQWPPNADGSLSGTAVACRNTQAMMAWIEKRKNEPLCDKDSPLQVAPGICRLPTAEEMKR